MSLRFRFEQLDPQQSDNDRQFYLPTLLFLLSIGRHIACLATERCSRLLHAGWLCDHRINGAVSTAVESGRELDRQIKRQRVFIIVYIYVRR